MKKLVVFVLSAIMLVCIFAGSALADGDPPNSAFGFTALTDGRTLTHAEQYLQIRETNNGIEVRYRVIGPGSSEGFTNLICVYIQESNTFVGAKWLEANGIYYSIPLSSYLQGGMITVGGRGNTKYRDMLGLASVRLEGQFSVY